MSRTINMDSPDQGWPRDITLSGISDDSRTVKAGDIFFAIAGTRVDGRRFIDEAVARGAAAVVTDADFQGTVRGARLIRVADPRLALGRLAADFYNNPSSQMSVLGITGTNGKTTISYLLAEIFRRAGYEAGIIGTIAHQWGTTVIESTNTTPGALQLQRLLSDMAADGVRYCAMEVSSHSLDQERVYGIDFKTAIFTNITGEHLDYHETFGEYLRAKSKLFGMLGPQGLAVLNVDDENFDALARSAAGRMVTYGIRRSADVRAEDITSAADGTAFSVRTKESSYRLATPLIGMFNVYNILAAVAAARDEGISADIIRGAVSDFRGAPGRLEVVKHDGDFTIMVDYAHTDNALKNVLETLRKVTRRRLIVVFGCGGDRDRFKRPRMGAVASWYADCVLITSDNPRSENPMAIAKEIEGGIKAGYTNYRIVLDRTQAIREAVHMAQTDDMVVLAGKGHEKYQIIGDTVIPFSDTETAQRVLSERGLRQCYR